MGFIGTFWRGQSGFVVTVLLLIGISFALTYGARWVGWPIVVALAVVSVWQCVGAVRFAERVIQDGALSRVYGAYASMGVALVSNVLVGVGVVLPAPPVDLAVDGYEAKVTVDGETAVVSGAIDYQVLTELRGAGAVRRVVLHSEGGQVQAGRAIGLYLAQIGADTHVDDVCYSACTLVFAGGASRSLGPDGELGFHGYRFVDPLQVQTVEKSVIEDKDRAFLAARGIEAGFVEQVFATAPDALWRPTRAELTAAGVLR